MEITVLSYGDNPLASTGYGCIWENLLSRWAKSKPKSKFYHVGWQSIDREHKTAEGYIQLPTGRAEMGTDTIVPYIERLNPDYLITLADVGKQLGYVSSVFEAKKKGWKGKWIAYVPLDTPDWSLYWDEMFDAADIIIAMSKFGEGQMKKFAVNKKIIPILVGVDTKVYYPMSERNDLRKKYNIDDRFVVGFVGRNQIRKMQPYWMRGFANFAKGKSDVSLLLHTDTDPPAGEGRGWAINALIWKFEKEINEDLTDSKRIMLTRTKMDIKERQKISKEGMNEIYNLMDIFLYPTGGEGFGMPAIESQSAGVPLLMSDNTTGPELTKAGELINMLKDTHGRTVSVIGTNGVTNAIPDDKHVTELLEKYYADWKGEKKLLKKMSEDARKFALTFDWDNISKQWLDVFENER